MNPQDAIDLARDAIITALLLSAPALLAGTLVGLLVGLLQALTQIQDQTVSFVPKIIAMVTVVGFCLPWMLQRMAEYSEQLIENIPRLIAGG
jgi:flagellar biosynthetic protein FliQ